MNQAPRNMPGEQNKFLIEILQVVTDALIEKYVSLADGEITFYENFNNPQVQQQLCTNLQYPQKAELTESLVRCTYFEGHERDEMVRGLRSLSASFVFLGKCNPTNPCLKVTVNMDLHRVQNLSFQLTQELVTTYRLIEKTRFCLEPILRQFEIQIRRLLMYSFFWAELSKLQFRFQLPQAETLLTQEAKQHLASIVTKIQLEAGPVIPKQNEQAQRQVQRQASGRQESLNQIASQKQIPPREVPIIVAEVKNDQLLREAHEYYIGLGVKQNSVKALEIYLSLANKNDVTALVIMGQIMYEGKLCKQDFLKSYEYFQRASIQNNSQALYMMSRLILEEKVVDHNHPKLKNSQDMIRSQSSVVLFEQPGIHQTSLDIHMFNQIREDYDYALELLKKASAYHHLEATIQLGDIYSTGIMIDDMVIIDASRQWTEIYYTQAQQQQSPEASFKLALYYKQLNLIEKQESIEELLKTAQRLDYLPAYSELGKLYLTRHNKQMALLVYEGGAEKGDLRCKIKIMSLRVKELKDRDISLQDFFNYLEEECDKYPELKGYSFYFQGKIYMKGIGTEDNYEYGIELLKKGAQLGNEKCRRKLDSIYDSNYSNRPHQGTLKQSMNAKCSDSRKLSVFHRDTVNKKIPQHYVKSNFSNAQVSKQLNSQMNIVRMIKSGHGNRQRGCSDGAFHKMHQPIGQPQQMYLGQSMLLSDIMTDNQKTKNRIASPTIATSRVNYDLPSQLTSRATQNQISQKSGGRLRLISQNQKREIA